MDLAKQLMTLVQRVLLLLLLIPTIFFVFQPLFKPLTLNIDPIMRAVGVFDLGLLFALPG